MTSESTSPTQSSTVAVLKRIEARLSDSSRWCQRSSARDAGGSQIATSHANATQWCLDGAILLETRARNYETYSDIYGALARAASELYPSETGCVGVNDHLGHAAVMNVVRHAIELAEQGGTP